jgi:excisionase family DNA binding protein
MIQAGSLLRITEFASQLNVTVACVRRWVLLRKIQVVHVGRLVRIPAAELERIVRDGTVPVRTERGASRAQ